MCIVIYNITQTVEGSFVHRILQQCTESGGFYVESNLQQYTESGGFLCALKCTKVHRECRVLLFIEICTSIQGVDESYFHSNFQQYTESGGFLFS
jgi:hypothetical protein